MTCEHCGLEGELGIELWRKEVPPCKTVIVCLDTTACNRRWLSLGSAGPTDDKTLGGA